jgi:hypothetical protein
MNEHLDLSEWTRLPPGIRNRGDHGIQAGAAADRKLEEEKGIWESRISLAMERGAEDLRAEAEKKRGEVETALLSGFAKPQNSAGKSISSRFSSPPQARIGESVDADLLLAQLSLAVGDAKPTTARFARWKPSGSWTSSRRN